MVESALSGRNEAESLFCTELNEPTSGPPTPAASNQRATTTPASNLQRAFVMVRRLAVQAKAIGGADGTPCHRCGLGHVGVKWT
ncbi:hypothetical protein GCM10009668_36330 [Nocardioides dubius]|uniref:Uncharacterized protein n=1 Tax=Nocardioides dubius TaxID=317019 RepID=A0ABN1U0M6_9ACTN